MNIDASETKSEDEKLLQVRADMLQEGNKSKRQEKDLLAKLENYCKEDYVPMHMPGAKRNLELFQMKNPYEIDITEIDGFDNLHHAEEIIADSMKDAAKLFGAEETLYLINGSSAGILSAVCGATNRGDQILVARNCHVSVYNAIYMNGLEPVYFQPKCDVKTGIYHGVKIEEIRHFFEEEKVEDEKIEDERIEDEKQAGPRYIEKKGEIKAVVLTSPTYEGYVSDIKKIAAYLHERNIILIVDEAHGAHFHMSDAFPESAIELGADAVIQSIHKTLPSLTQTALLHLNGDLINRERVKMFWNIYQTTSPSYVLMGGIDRCVSILVDRGPELFQAYVERLKKLRNQIKQLSNIQLLDTDDISKIVLVIPEKSRIKSGTMRCMQEIDGKMLQQILLKKYHIQLEMASVRYVIAMTSIGDTDVYYDRFLHALVEIDEEILEEDEEIESCNKRCLEKQLSNQKDVVECSESEILVQDSIDMRMNPTEAIDSLNKTGGELLELSDAVSRISGAQVCMYPPGIPLVNPGECITEEIIKILNKGTRTGLEVMGLKEGKILCLK